MRITFVTPPLQREKFSGGILCILSYAKGLASLGHQVTVFPYLKTQSPDWFPKPWGFDLSRPQIYRMIESCIQAGFSALGRMGSGDVKGAKDKIKQFNGALSTLMGQRASYGITKGAAIENLIKFLPDGDVTIATDFKTAYPVALAGKGTLYYFSQHYEPLFWREDPGGEIARKEAEISYQLGLRQIVNSPWLENKIRERHGVTDIRVCSNAIDHEIFNAEPKPRSDSSTLRIISYGGRDAEWKGFKEMCEGVRIARERLPDINLDWSVYGTALLPPSNPIAAYRPLGFLKQSELQKAYADNDVLLSASWYESFPLFPIEAMASGLATICTQPGTEVYAQAGISAEVIAAQSPESIAAALIKLACDEAYRMRLATAGKQKSREFTWERSIKSFESILQNAQ